MRYPIPERLRTPIFWLMFVATLALMVLMSGARLRTAAAPQGIISFELAGSEAKAREIIASWDEATQRAADTSLRIDFLYLIAYSTTIGLACAWAAKVFRARGWALGVVGEPLAWALWLAALLDAFENIALLRLLHGTVVSPWPQIARACATVKFILVGIGLLYFIIGAATWLIGRLGIFGRQS